MGSNKSKIAYEICIVTGDYKEVEDSPSLFIMLYDDKSVRSPIFQYDNLIQIEDGKIEVKYIIESRTWCKVKNFGKLAYIEFWRSPGAMIPYDWYLDKVIVRDRRKGLRGYWEYFFFPVHRWIENDRKYYVSDCETCKAHEDLFLDERKNDIKFVCDSFALYQRSSGFPVEVEYIPDFENFSSFKKWDIETAVKAAIEQRRLTDAYEDMSYWDSLEELNDMYVKNNITEPIGVKQSILDDICFGGQRLKGCNPLVLKLCTQIPENFEVTMDWLKPHLEGWTVNHVIAARRLYIIDYKIMNGLSCKPDRIMPSPMALFFITEERFLKPLAIQLTQKKEGGNLVFLPSDPPALWNLAKMWFNLSDACHHVIVGRLVNQMVLENIYVSLRTNLGQSHPIYQILAPHFQHCLIVSKTLKDFVFSKNGWIARNIQLSKKGIKQLVKKGYAEWSFDLNANLHKDLETRKVYDMKALNNYPYRDDALLVYSAITNYVRKLVKIFYPNKNDLLQDQELQNWRQNMADPMEIQGMGLKGIPGGVNSKPNNGYLATLERNSGAGDSASVLSGGTKLSASQLENNIYVSEDLVRLLTGIIHLSVVVCGSALRMPMYDEYGNPLNYPLQLRGSLPADPGAYKPAEHHSIHDSEAAVIGEAITSALPTKHAALDVLISVRMAARVDQSALGQFDSDYLYHEKAVVALEDFRKELKQIHEKIEQRNVKRDIYHQYYCLDPMLLPNYPGV